jgi:hypothetical protein
MVRKQPHFVDGTNDADDNERKPILLTPIAPLSKSILLTPIAPLSKSILLTPIAPLSKPILLTPIAPLSKSILNRFRLCHNSDNMLSYLGGLAL